MYAELKQDMHPVVHLADLSFAQGNVGEQNPLPDQESKIDFANDMANEVRIITKANTAYCGDEREIERMEDGSSSEEYAFRLFGGIGLATTKALVSADASVVKGAVDIRDAYIKTVEVLTDLGYEDAGHEDCGARKKVKASVESVFDETAVSQTMALFGVTDSEVTERLAHNKKALLKAGFYDSWNPEEHEKHLKDLFPQNYAYLKGEHEGSGLVVVTSENLTLTSNGRAFAVTVELMKKLAYQFSSGSVEEEARIYAAFVDDTIRVGGLIVKKDFPAFVV